MGYLTAIIARYHEFHGQEPPLPLKRLLGIPAGHQSDSKAGHASCSVDSLRRGDCYHCCFGNGDTSASVISSTSTSAGRLQGRHGTDQGAATSSCRGPASTSTDC